MEIIFHPDAYEELTKSLPPKLAIKIMSLIELIEEDIQLTMPDSKPLGSKLFELRVRERNNIARCVYAYAKDNKVYILRAIVKKTQKLNKHDIEISLKRLDDLKLKYNHHK